MLNTGTSTFDRVHVVSSGTYGIYVTGSASPTFTNCVVRNSGSYGIYVAHTTSGQSATIDNCTLNANGTYNFLSNATSANSASISITDSIITNASYGVYRSDSATINVTYTNVWNNSTNYCNEEFDALVEQARSTADEAERYELYAQMEEMLFGPDGDMPVLPIYFYTNVSLQRESIKETFDQNLLDQIDLTKVVEGDGEEDEGV